MNNRSRESRQESYFALNRDKYDCRSETIVSDDQVNFEIKNALYDYDDDTVYRLMEEVYTENLGDPGNMV